MDPMLSSPAASDRLAQIAQARRAGAHTVELNLEPSEGATRFHEAHHGPASKVVPMYVERILQGAT